MLKKIETIVVVHRDKNYFLKKKLSMKNDFNENYLKQLFN